MSCCGSAAGTPEEQKANSQIEKDLKKDKQRLNNEIKLLLLGKIFKNYFYLDRYNSFVSLTFVVTLIQRIIVIKIHWTYFFTGAGESGKSTIAKQMKIIHRQWFYGLREEFLQIHYFQ